MNRALSFLKSLAWMAAIWSASVGTLAVVAWVLRRWLKPA